MDVSISRQHHHSTLAREQCGSLQRPAHRTTCKPTGYRKAWRQQDRQSDRQPSSILEECTALSVFDLGARPRVEPAGLLGRKTREVQETVYYWTIDGTDLTVWVTQRVQHPNPAAPREETIWLAGNPEDASDRLERL